MRTITANFFISLDGVVESPETWQAPFFDDAMGEIIGSAMQAQTGLLLGRTLYDEWSQFFPAHADDPMAARMNATTKYVITHRPLPGPVWSNSSAVEGTAQAVREFKAAGDGLIGMSGSAATVRWLIGEGLLDELALLVHPVVVGAGARLFDGMSATSLRLLECRTLPTGVLYQRYALAPTS